MTALRATCMCKAVSFTATPTTGTAGVCHCRMCSQWTGGMFIAVAVQEDIAIPDDAPLNVFQSSEWGERVSCAVCGSTLIWRTRDGQHNNVSVHAFDDPGQFPVTDEIYIDKKPATYALAQDTRKMTEAEVLAMYAPKQEG